MAKTVEEIRLDVVSLIDNDLKAAEIQLAIFSAALISYRRDSCLRPFPDFLQSNDGENRKDVQQLEEIYYMIPPLNDLKNKHNVYSIEVWRLLQWILNNKIFQIASCENTVIKELQAKTGHSSFRLQPDYIFEVKYATNSSKCFDDKIIKHGIKYGYHGSRMDNFYSIISNGLQVHMMKNGLFGDGIYLCEDLAVAMPYVNGGKVWKNSTLGEQLSCVAVCEILDHPAVKYQIGEAKDKKKRRSIAENSQCGEVPEKYFVVTKSDLLRIKYLLVFLDRKPLTRLQRRCNWICVRYPVACILFVYIFFLVLMGLWKTRTVQTYVKRNWKICGEEDE